MRGADCWTDHRLVRSIMRIQIRPAVRKKSVKKRLNVSAFADLELRSAFQDSVTDKLQVLRETDPTIAKDTESLTKEWSQISSCLIEASEETIGFSSRKHKDWFDENNASIRALLKAKNEAHVASICSPQNAVLRERSKKLRSHAQIELRRIENVWWTEKAKEIQHYADTNDSQKLFDAIKAIYGPSQHTLQPVRAKDGTTMLREQHAILSRWAEHFKELLNCDNPYDTSLLDELPQLPSITDIDGPPSLEEVHNAVKGLKNNKAAGPDGIPGEILKNGGPGLLRKLHQFIVSTWNSGKVPQQWKDANIITIYKRKGDRADCNNSRGISLLSTAGKVLARIMLNRLLSKVADVILPESQCGFRQSRSTSDMIFVARLLQEKCREQHQDLYLAFIDLTKAFDTVNRELLWNVLRKFGCPPHFLAVLQELHDGMLARVVAGGLESELFAVLVGVKQGCVLAPVIFIIFLAAVTLTFRNNITEEDFIRIKYRLDGSLFNRRRLQATTKVSTALIVEMQYADDAAVPSHSVAGLQRNLDAISAAYRRAGLQVNTRKTEIVCAQTNKVASKAAPFLINGKPIAEVKQFTYLGSILSHNCELTSEIQQRTKQAYSAFGRLSHRVFHNHNLTLATKVLVYKAVCISALLYGCETWTPYRQHIKMLERCNIRCLQSMLGIRWWHKVTHTETRSRASIPSIEYLLYQRQLRWVGHVCRMEPNRLPRQLLYGELQQGQRSVGRPKKRFADHIKAVLRLCNITPASLESLAKNRANWWNACSTGLDAWAVATARVTEEHRLKRHTTVAATPAGPACQQCGRICASEFGLRSHMRAHNKVK